MKIGILTLPLHTNYGGILQAYALQTILERMGHDVKVLDKKQHHSLPKGPRTIRIIFNRIVNRYIRKKEILINEEKVYNETYPLVSQYTQTFINKYINDYILDDLRKIREGEFDAIIVGSDQIWRASYYHPIEYAYLSFAEKWNIKRIAYAASFGTDQWEYSKKQTEICRRLIEKFDGVSVREESGVELCDSYFGVKAQHVLDPTMILGAEDYLSLLRKENITPNGRILNYVLDNTEIFNELVTKIASIQGKEIFRINSRFEEYSAPIDERIQPPVESWLASFINSDLIVTDSFHACVFSIIFRKEFVVIGNNKRGLSRINSLLKMFDLSNRLVKTLDDYLRIKDSCIDYNVVYSKLSDYRMSSIDFLNINLKCKI